MTHAAARSRSIGWWWVAVALIAAWVAVRFALGRTSGDNVVFLVMMIVPTAVQRFRADHRGSFNVRDTAVGPRGSGADFADSATACIALGADGCATLECRRAEGGAPVLLPLLTYYGNLRGTPHDYELLVAAVRANPSNTMVADQLDSLVAGTVERSQFANDLRGSASPTGAAGVAADPPASGASARWTPGAWMLFALAALLGFVMTGPPLRMQILCAVFLLGCVVVWFAGRSVDVNTEGTRITLHWQHFDAAGRLTAQLIERDTRTVLRVCSGLHRARSTVSTRRRQVDPATWLPVAAALHANPANADVADRLMALAAAH